MEIDSKSETNNPVVLFLVSEIMLAFIMALYFILWGCWLFPSAQVGNFASVLLEIIAISVALYFLVTSLTALAFLWEGRKRYFKCGEALWFDRKAFKRFVFNMTCCLLMLLGFFFCFVSALDGEIPFFLENTRAIEGPDTNYARAAFKRLLDRPVPAHVSQIYFQDRSSFDLDQRLQFNTMDESFVRALVRELKMEPAQSSGHEEIFIRDAYTLYYDRNSGIVRFEWFTT